jgi:hypothetical protein
VWEVIGTDEFVEWRRSLTDDQKAAINGRVELLQEEGPALGRPVVDTIKTSHYPNMKELRCSKDGALRVLFIFDPLRRAVLLLGGDKADDSAWNKWYRKAVRRADRIYKEYLTDKGMSP